MLMLVNSHLSNNGVEESPPHGRGLTNLVNGEHHGPKPRDLFIDLEGCNVGFHHWHPIPVTHNGNKLCGQSDMGGVWEWTSSPLARFEGFKPMDLYPEYTGKTALKNDFSLQTDHQLADFFDEKHNIILGGSWATHPRLAGRKTL